MITKLAPTLTALIGPAPLLYVPAAVVGGLNGLILLLNLCQAHNHFLFHFFLTLGHAVNIDAPCAAEASGILGNLYRLQRLVRQRLVRVSQLRHRGRRRGIL